jgi:hypothetical protein
VNRAAREVVTSKHLHGRDASPSRTHPASSSVEPGSTSPSAFDVDTRMRLYTRRPGLQTRAWAASEDAAYVTRLGSGAGPAWRVVEAAPTGELSYQVTVGEAPCPRRGMFLQE